MIFNIAILTMVDKTPYEHIFKCQIFSQKIKLKKRKKKEKEITQKSPGSKMTNSV